MSKQITFDSLPNSVAEIHQKLEAIEALLLGHSSKSQPAEKTNMSVQEAADFLKLSVPTIYSKVSKGELPYMKASKRLYFSKTELQEYIKSGRKKTSTEALIEAPNNLSK